MGGNHSKHGHFNVSKHEKKLLKKAYKEGLVKIYDIPEKTVYEDIRSRSNSLVITRPKKNPAPRPYTVMEEEEIIRKKAEEFPGHNIVFSGIYQQGK